MMQQKTFINQNFEFQNHENIIHPNFGQYCQNEFNPLVGKYYSDQLSSYIQTQNNPIHQFSNNYSYIQELQYLQARHFGYLQNPLYFANIK